MSPTLDYLYRRHLCIDRRAVYRYVKSLGPRGLPAPNCAAPGRQIATSHFVLVPRNPPQKTATR